MTDDLCALNGGLIDDCVMTSADNRHTINYETLVESMSIEDLFRYAIRRLVVCGVTEDQVVTAFREAVAREVHEK